MSAQDTEYKISGTLLDKDSREPISGLTIRAFDVDFLTEDDFLGEAKSDENGKFIIEYNETDFVTTFLGSLFEGGPDIKLKIYDDPQKAPIHITRKRSGASRFESYLIELKSPKPSRERFTVWLKHAKALSNCGADTIKDLVDLLQPAAGRTPKIGGISPADATKMLIDIGLSPLPHGFLFREQVIAHFEKSSQNINFKGVLEALEAISKKTQADNKLAGYLAEALEFVRSASLADPFKADTALTDHPSTFQVFRSTVVDQSARKLKLHDDIIWQLKAHFPTTDFFMNSKDEDISNVIGVDLGVITKLKLITCWMIPGLRFQQAEPVADSSLTPTEVAVFHTDIPDDLKDLRGIIGEGSPLQDDDLKEVIRIARKAAPDVAYYHSSIRPLQLDSETKEYLKGFKTFKDLKKTDFFEKVRNTMTVKDIALLKDYGRLNRVSNNFTLNTELIDKEIHSSYQIAKIPLKQFKDNFSYYAKKSELGEVHGKACAAAAQAMPVAMSAYLASQDLHSDKVFPGAPELKQLIHTTINSATGCSGIEAPCECPHWASVLSPAAYLYALFAFVEEHFGVSRADLIKNRIHRIELEDSLLNKEMINQPVNQIEIAIEALIHYWEKTIGISEFSNIYKALMECKNPLPFYYHATRFKEYLTILGTSLQEIHAVFADPRGELELPHLAELLGVTYVEMRCITDSLDQEKTAKVLGISNDAAGLNGALGDNTDAAKLAGFLGLCKEDFDSLLLLPWVNDGNTTRIEIAEFDLIRRITALARVLGVIISDMMAFLTMDKDAFPPAPGGPVFNKDNVERIYRMNLLVNLLGMTGTTVSDIVDAGADDSLKNDLARALGINLEEQLLLIPTSSPDWISTFPDLEKVCKRLQLARELGVSVNEMTLIMRAANNDELAEKLGMSVDELQTFETEVLKDTNLSDDELKLKRKLKLGGTFGISGDDLDILLQFQLEDAGDVLNDIEKINTICRFELLHRPIRLVQTLGLNIEELKSIKTSISLNFNSMTYDKIFLAHRMVALGRILGLDISGLIEELINPITDRTELLAKALRFPPVEMKDLLDKLGLTANNINGCDRIYWLYRITVLYNSLSMKSVDELFSLKKWEHEIEEEDDVTDLYTILNNQYSDAQLEKEKAKSDERIWEQTRIVICEYIISKDEDMDSIKTLSDHLLIDLETSPKTKTSRIQQAIESIQTYVMRIRTGQEVNVDPQQLEEEAWKSMEKGWRWMKRYAMWEAAMKVFLYPENYVMPSLRDNKSPFFNEFEDELSQGEVTEGLAQKAISNYIEKLHAISALRVSGVVCDSKTDTLHIFARSQIDEKATFHRTLKYQAVWSPWVRLEADIKADKVCPLIAYGRLYVFWIEMEKGDENLTYKHKLFYIYTVERGKWSKARCHELLGISSFIEFPDLKVKVIDDKITIFIGWIARFTLSCNDSLYSYCSDSEHFPFKLHKKFIPPSISVEGNSLVFYPEKKEWSGARLELESGPPYDVLGDVDDTFKVDIDNGIKIGSSTYLFCSDQKRCLMIDARIGVEICGIKQVEFTIHQLNYGKYCKLTDKLFQEGLDGLYDHEFQTAQFPELDFQHYSPNTQSVIKTPSAKFDFTGPNKIYNWELFFQIPYFIADGLSQNRKFEAASKWFHYICNPYSGNGQTQEAAWYFAPFVEEAVQQLADYINDPEDAAVWWQDPFSPHALARVRPGAYQKAIILAYIDNLLQWADQEFTRDTRESINRARGLYLLGEHLLKLKEIEQENPCDRMMLNISVAIVAAVGRSKASLLIEKLNNLCILSKKKVQQIYTEIMAVAKANASEALKALKIEAILDSVEPSDCVTLIENSDENTDNAIWAAEDYCEAVGMSPGLVELQSNAIQFLASCMAGCVPENPIFEMHRSHIEGNLRKLRAGRNLAGVQRILPMYEASIDPMSVVRTISSGAGLDALNFSNAEGIGPYRFAYLIERAKSLANLVAQAGNALLLAIEKKESEELTYVRAQQELGLAKANVHLRKLGVAEAENYETLMKYQTERTKIEFDHYSQLIDKGVLQYEEEALNLMRKAAVEQEDAVFLQQIAAVAGSALSAIAVKGGDISGYISSLAAIANVRSLRGTMYSSQSSIASMKASFKRREQEWKLRKKIAKKDYEVICPQNELIATDRLAIAQMEQQIAEMNAENTDKTLEFLKEKFTNKELYSWMTKQLSKLLYGFYNLAYTTARMAQATLEFERNESCPFISYEYWDSEKKGLLSGDKLLLDLNRLDDHYIQKNFRKLEITKHISVANMAPEALADLRRDGVALFDTPMSWFDRDFPGHYHRIIKGVKVSVLALIGPTTGINATLSTTSDSVVVVDVTNPKSPMEADVSRVRSVALSAPTNASGLFELNYRDERYLPFEGNGVDVSWKLEMPKPSNRFNFDSIVDVIMTMDYTALSDQGYKEARIDKLGTYMDGMLPLSLRSTFPDAWYHFNHPVWLKPNGGDSDPYANTDIPEPYTIQFETTRAMFPPNEENHYLSSIGFMFSLDNVSAQIPFRLHFTPENGQTPSFSSNPLRTDGKGYCSLSELRNKQISPFGKWEIIINRDFAPEALWAKNKDGSAITEDISNPGHHRPVLDIKKVKDVIVAFTYGADLNWPTPTDQQQ